MDESERQAMTEAEESKKLALLAAAAECTQEEYDEINEHIQHLPLKDQVSLSLSLTTTTTTTSTTANNDY